MLNSRSRTERRESRRFKLAWGLSVAGRDRNGRLFDELAMLTNLSSRGAFFYPSRPLTPGMTVLLRIRIPIRKQKWMQYVGKVVRADRAGGAAVKFDEPRPVFHSW